MNIIKRACLTAGWAALVACGATLATSASAAPYPTQTIRLIVAFAPGGIADITARIIAPKLTQILGQSVIIENRAGAGGNVGAQSSKGERPDGYTFLVTTTSFAVNPALWGKDAGYSAENDFAPVGLISTQPNVIVVNSAVPAKNIAELKALAGQRSLSYGTPGTGTTPQLTGDNLFHVIWKANMPAIPYRGAGPAAVAVLANETPVASVAVASVVPYLGTNKIRALAVSSKERVPSMPDVPTLYELGYKDIQDYTWTAMLAPKGTPPEVVKVMNDAINKALAMPDVKKLFASQALEPVGGTPDQFKQYLATEMVRWARIVKATGATRD